MLATRLRVYPMGFLSAVLCSLGATACASPEEPESRSADQPNIGAVDTPVVGGCCNVGPSEPTINGLRITAQSGTAVPTVDVPSATILYAAAHSSAAIALFDGSAWLSRIANPMPSVAVPSTANINYDVFAYWDGTNVRIELAAWPSALSVQDGVQTKTGDATRRYIGAVATDATGKLVDTKKRRWVWNRDNQVPRLIVGAETAGAWNYSNSTPTGLREVNNSATSRIEIFAGSLGSNASYVSVQAQAQAIMTSPVGSTVVGLFNTGIGLDSTTVNAAQTSTLVPMTNALYGSSIAVYEGYLAAGRHWLSWLEGTQGTVTLYVLGKASVPALGQLGVVGNVEM